MGYRSYGWLVIPTQIYNKVKTAQGPEGVFQKWESDWDETESNEKYTMLHYNDWKMYDSYPTVAKFYEVVDKLEEHHSDLVVGKVITPKDDDYLWSVTQKVVGDTTINQFVGPQEITQDWDWAYGEMGEEVDDYTLRCGYDYFGMTYETDIDGGPNWAEDKWIFMSVKNKVLRDNLKNYIEKIFPNTKIVEEKETGFGMSYTNYNLWANTYIELHLWENQLNSQEKSLLDDERGDNSFSWAGVYDWVLTDDEEAYMWDINQYGKIEGPSI